MKLKGDELRSPEHDDRRLVLTKRLYCEYIVTKLAFPAVGFGKWIRSYCEHSTAVVVRGTLQ